MKIKKSGGGPEGIKTKQLGGVGGPSTEEALTAAQARIEAERIAIAAEQTIQPARDAHAEILPYLDQIVADNKRDGDVAGFSGVWRDDIIRETNDEKKLLHTTVIDVANHERSASGTATAGQADVEAQQSDVQPAVDKAEAALQRLEQAQDRLNLAGATSLRRPDRLETGFEEEGLEDQENDGMFEARAEFQAAQAAYDAAVAELDREKGEASGAASDQEAADLAVGRVAELAHEASELNDSFARGLQQALSSIINPGQGTSSLADTVDMITVSPQQAKNKLRSKTSEHVYEKFSRDITVRGNKHNVKAIEKAVSEIDALQLVSVQGDDVIIKVAAPTS